MDSEHDVVKVVFSPDRALCTVTCEVYDGHRQRIAAVVLQPELVDESDFALLAASVHDSAIPKLF